MLIVVFTNLFKALDLIERACHIEIFKSHSGLEESLELETAENYLFL